MTSHPDAEALAFLAEGLLEADEERTVTAHTETCATCAQTLEQLSGVSRVLAAVPAPELPRDVADLLDQRIAEAARERSAEPGTGADTHAAVDTGLPVTPLARARRRRFSPGLPHLVAAAAAAVFVVGGGAAVLNGALSHSESGVSTAVPFSDGAGEAAPEAAQAYEADLVNSGTVYTDAGLDEQAVRVLESASSGADPLGQATAPAVARCIERFEASLGLHVTLVDDAHYRSASEPVWVFYTTEGTRVGVHVVPPCSGSDEAAPDVLASTTVPAP
ncbi:anti-sigma factor family protein [Nocardiopsis sp. LOL_012]|uniref:anti-sigma factor family protein n=1 Tax=Nocardiopsis sp. LOL_012 TaxID=3345409 RepID=UPI003A86D97F